MSDAHDGLSKLREEINLATSNLCGAMQGIADSYRELSSGTGRGFNVHAQYRENSINTGKPLAELSVELAAWAAEIAAKAAAVDAKRAVLKHLEDQGGTHGVDD